VLAGAAAVGCSARQWQKHPRLMTEDDVADALGTALEGELPDDRRWAVNRIAETAYLTHDVVVETLGKVALTDESQAVRCAAVQALARSGQPGAVPPLLALLQQTPDRAARRSAATVALDARFEAARALLVLARTIGLPEEHQPALRQVCIRLVAQDRSRDIRQAATCLLGYLPDGEVLEPLVGALEQRDFGVVYEAERSLMRLTGRTFDHDAQRWREWIKETENPFADAGRLDAELAPPQKNWFEQQWDSTVDSMAALRPKKDRP